MSEKVIIEIGGRKVDLVKETRTLLRKRFFSTHIDPLTLEACVPDTAHVANAFTIEDVVEHLHDKMPEVGGLFSRRVNSGIVRALNAFVRTNNVILVPINQVMQTEDGLKNLPTLAALEITNLS